jgi:hypothetical protein
VIGIFSDSEGDLEAFDAAYELLRRKGARRFIFAGGRYSDLDEWALLRRQRADRAGSYSDLDFLADVTNYLGDGDQLARPPAFSEEDSVPAAPVEDLEKVKSRFLRVDPSVSNLAMDMLGDALCCVVHDKNSLTREDLLNATVIIHGRAPEPKVVQIGTRFFVTAGQLTGAAEQTCGLLEVVERNLRFSAFSLDGRAVVDGQVLVLDRRTKLSVK